jgi:hypothetical protein
MSKQHFIIKWMNKLELYLLINRATRLRNNLDVTEKNILDHLKKHTAKGKSKKRALNTPPLSNLLKKSVILTR